MKIIKKRNKYQLDGWEKKDWLNADDFLFELIDSEADYQVIPKLYLDKVDLMNNFNKVIQSASLKQLYKLREKLEREISLGETAKAEGLE
jgi:hypothetical protein